MIVSFLHSALVALLALCRAAAERGTETHAYLLGRRSLRELIITTVLRAGAPAEHAAMTRPDYAASAQAMQPLLDRGELLLGEAHLHLGFVGPSSGDRQTLLDIPASLFPHYLGVVVTFFPDEREPVVTAHSVQDGRLVEHDVRMTESAYLALLPPPSQRVLQIGAGSGGCLVATQVAKLPITRLDIVDGDRFEERNLTRHIATRRVHGRSKARYLAGYLRPRASMPVTAVHLEVSPATKERVAQLVAEHDLIINATGHPPTSILISQLCAAAGRACIHAGVFTRGSGGFVFTQTPTGPCYECLYDLQRQQTTEDPRTLEALSRQYGYSEEDLSAQQGLWADVNTTASIQAKVVLDYLKFGDDPRRPNLYVIDNQQLSITNRRVQSHSDCTTCQEAS